MLESLDGGKPIRESRDVDLPLAAAHFFYYAGWADKLEYAFPNRRPRPLGVAGQIIPWNFPLLMLSWKIAPGARGREHGRAQARRDDAAHRAPLRGRPPPGGAACRASSTSSRATAARAPSSSSTPTSTRSRSPARPRSARRSCAPSPARGKKLTLELGGKAANIIFDDAPLDQAVEGIVNGIYFNQGHVCCAGSRLFVQESIVRGGARQAEAADGHAARRRPARQEHRRRRHQLPRAARADRGARRERGRGRRRDLPAAVPAAREGLVVPAHRLHERRPELPHRAGGDLRARALRAHLPHARRGGREGEQHAVRPLGRRVDGEGLAHPLHGAAPARGRHLGEHVQPLRPGLAVRRLQGVRLRPRGRPPRPRARTWSSTSEPTARSRRPTSSTSAARSRAPSRGAPTRSRARTSRSPRARTSATPSAPPGARSRRGPR